MVIVFDAQLAITPKGSPLAAPIPVAPPVVWVIGVSAEFMHKMGEAEAELTVFTSLTVIIPPMSKVPQVNGMVMV